ncbi:MAG: YjjG family noncanonical pyrimidine nucleotidase [Clostridia bacterium]|nr:YjjG family noncanonical pyrimidine nucleotidase [Clostridia bacterium]
MNFTTLLWDVDGTLLDFKAAEKAAVKALFREFSLGECTDEMVRRYSQINEVFWQRLERNELTKPQILVGRFEQFFTEVGIPASLAPAFNDRYQFALGDTIVFRDDSIRIVRSLRGRVKQYAVTNGTVAAQNRKLAASGLKDLLDGAFLSEGVGAEKPNMAFFDAVFEAIRPGDLSKILIIGDSLTSDIRGGNNAGIKTCWYNPDKLPARPGFQIDFTVSDLREILDIV